MSKGFASALEISARVVRDHLHHPGTARRLIPERLHRVSETVPPDDAENGYVRNMELGFRAALDGMYAIAQRGEK